MQAEVVTQPQEAVPAREDTEAWFLPVERRARNRRRCPHHPEDGIPGENERVLVRGRRSPGSTSLLLKVLTGAQPSSAVHHDPLLQ